MRFTPKMIPLAGAMAFALGVELLNIKMRQCHARTAQTSDAQQPSTSA